VQTVEHVLDDYIDERQHLTTRQLESGLRVKGFSG
jgi:hypothetical protein